MKNENETKKKLLACAKMEFLEKGYVNTSLRSICKCAGVTTGALYFFFKDKEELFDGLVRETVDDIYKMVAKHYELELSEEKVKATNTIDFSDDLQCANELIRYMYQHYDEMQLLLTKAQGSRYEYIIDEFVDVTEKHYRILANEMTRAAGIETFGDYFIHWIAHMQIDVFVHLLTHETDVNKAEKHMKETINYLVAGWYGLLKKN